MQNSKIASKYTKMFHLVHFALKCWDKLTPAASKILTTASEISGPIPSPGIRVQVCAALEGSARWKTERNNFDISKCDALKMCPTCKTAKKYFDQNLFLENKKMAFGKLTINRSYLSRKILQERLASMKNCLPEFSLLNQVMSWFKTFQSIRIGKQL